MVCANVSHIKALSHLREMLLTRPSCTMYICNGLKGKNMDIFLTLEAHYSFVKKVEQLLGFVLAILFSQFKYM